MLLNDQFLKISRQPGFSRGLNKLVRVFVLVVYLLYTLGLPTMSVYAQTYTLTVTVNPLESGVITLYPDTGSYAAGTDVTLTPIPDPGYAFSGWSGTNVDDLVDNSDGTWTINMDEAKTLTANFIDVTTVQANTTLTGTALSAFTATFPDTIPAEFETAGYRINSRMTLGELLPSDATMDITKTTNGGTPLVFDDVPIPHTLTFWWTDLFTGLEPYLFTNTTYRGTVEVYNITDIKYSGGSLTLDKPVKIESIISNHGFIEETLVVLAETYILNTDVSPAGTGTVTNDPVQEIYASGTEVTITATPATGYHFVEWTGDISTVANTAAATTTITMNGDYTVTANFELNTYKISGTVTDGTDPIQNVTVSGGADLTDVTDGLGSYELTVDHDWTGTIAPSLDGYSFDPVSRDYESVSEDKLQQDYRGLINLSNVSITGTAKYGETLTALLEPDPTTATATYQWLISNNDIDYTAIENATASSYVITAGDVGKYLKVEATGTGVYTGTVTSAAAGPVTAATITIAAIPGVTVPVQGIAPVDTITATDQYTGTVTWDPDDTAFEYYTVYTATITLTPKAGYTLTEVPAGFFTVTGADTVTNDADSGVVTAVFPRTEAEPLTEVTIEGTAEYGQTLVATVTPAGATVDYQWLIADKIDGIYSAIPGAENNTYMITSGGVGKYIRVEATGNQGYTGKVLSYPAGPVVARTISLASIPGVGVPIPEETPVTTIAETIEYSGTVIWDPDHTEFEYFTVYTATITLTPKAGYTLTGVPADFFTVAGADTVTNAADSGVVTAVFPQTALEPLIEVSILGTAEYGQTLTAILSPDGATADYQWLISTDDVTYDVITDATNSSYDVAAGDVGKFIKVEATGTGAYTGTVTSTSVGPVDPRPIIVTAVPQTKVYGDQDPELAYQVTSGSLIEGDAFTGKLERNAGEDVGDYAITQGSLTLGSSYAMTYVSAVLTITEKAASVTPDVGQSKEYGETDPELTGVLAGFLVADGVTAEFSRVSGEDVGSYAISAELSPAGVLANYDITYTPVDFTISARPITVTAEDKKKTVDEPDPELTYQITSGGLVFDDSITGDLDREPGETIGEYDILQGTLAIVDGNDGNNYDMTFVPGTFIINAVLDADCITVNSTYIEKALAVNSSEVVNLSLTNTCDYDVGFDMLERETIIRQDFEEGLMPPTGWMAKVGDDDADGIFEWTLKDSLEAPLQVDQGRYAAWASFESTNYKDEWLLSPEFDPAGLSDLTLTFRAYSSTVYWREATLQIWVTDTDGNPIIDFSNDPIWDMMRDETWEGGEHRTVFVDLSDFAGYSFPIRIAWRYVGVRGNSVGVDMIDISASSEVPWLSESPSWGPIPANETISIDLIFDTSDLVSGTYFGTIQPLPFAPLPVTMIVVDDINQLYLPLISR